MYYNKMMLAINLTTAKVIDHTPHPSGLERVDHFVE
jgi:hypothetical protein